MKGDITLNILEKIEDLIGGGFNLMDAFLSAGYGASLNKIDYEFSKRQSRSLNEKIERKYQRQIRQRFYSMLYKLEKDGLIKKSTKKEKLYLKLTQKGKDYLSILREKKKKALPSRVYNKSNGNNFIIIIFDVPEKERRKRDWLRFAIANIGFKLIQKSVWIGKVKIPEEFLEDLRKLDLIDFVEIFEINKTGSLKQIT